jgi:hypothetical protein
MRAVARSIHILDQLGNLLGAVDVDCTDDEAAKERLREVADGCVVELWRLTTVFEADSPSVQPSHEELLARGRGPKRRTRSH